MEVYLEIEDVKYGRMIAELISNLIIINHTQKENAVLLALKDLLVPRGLPV